MEGNILHCIGDKFIKFFIFEKALIWYKCSIELGVDSTTKIYAFYSISLSGAYTR